MRIELLNAQTRAFTRLPKCVAANGKDVVVVTGLRATRKRSFGRNCGLTLALANDRKHALPARFDERNEAAPVNADMPVQCALSAGVS